NDIKSLITAIQSNTITDIFIVGYIDYCGATKQFHPMLENIYIELGQQLLRCSSIEQYDKLRMTLVEKITCDFEIDDDDEFCIISISQMYLLNSHVPNYITSLHVFVNGECHPQEGVFKCAGLGIGDHDYLFLDPTHIFGIHLGKMEAQI